MTEAERKARRKQWKKIIARWKREKIDRTKMVRGTLDDEPERPFLKTTDERVEAMMKLRWINYGPDALYGRMERVLRFGKLPRVKVSDRGRSGRTPLRQLKGSFLK